MQKKVRKENRPVSRPVTEKDVRKDLGYAAGSEFFENRDPLYHVAESFQMTFDKIGREHARTFQAENGAGFSREELEQERQDQQKSAPPETAKRGRGVPERSLRGETLPNSNAVIPMEKFSEIAFQRGNLSGAILGGTGKMMLVSSLKRTIGQSGPKRQQQQTLQDVGAQKRNIPNRNPDMMVFNRTFTDAAVGLVVDTIRESKRVVQSMQDMLHGTGEIRGDVEASVLFKQYPFLDDGQERELIAAYEQRLAESADPRERAVLQNGIARARALIAKKDQMKVLFTNKLRLLSDRATEALAEFTADTFAQEVYAEVFGERETDPEPPDGGRPGAEDDDASERSEG